MRIPISVKLVIMTVVILIGVTVPIALKSSEFFENTSKQREESINLDFAAARATEVENILSNLFEKTRTTAMTLYKMSGQNNMVNEDLEINFGRDKNFISLEVQKIDGSSFVSVSKRVKEDVFKNAGLTSGYLSVIRQRLPFPVANVAQGKLEIQNSTLEKGPAMFTIGVPIVSDPVTKKITHIAIADINLAVLLKPFSEIKERTFFVVDKTGVLLAHSDEKKAMARLNMKENQIVKVSAKAEVARGQKPFFDGNEKFFGAYAKTSYGVTVFSQISEDLILEPAREVKRKAFYIAGIALSISLFFVFVFSMTLTSPLEILVGLIGLVSKGNFDVKATSKVKSMFEDEVGQLAHAFDNMTDGLKERDKVKTLFSKFHGSSVTDDLLQGDIGVGGARKEVVVFFSDIRGFTAFSENRAPEEVVEMLNEYFAVMVSLINKHHGVVDKFIGDAIMAIWGAPKTTGKDAAWAVRACLEMRRGLETLNQKRIARGQPAINIGMGLHAGSAISGTIGSDERMEYTVIGNTVNTGSRIEASTKAFGADLLISESVYEMVKDDFLIELAGAAEVKGRTDAIKMYKVRGYKDESGNMVEVKTPYSDYEAEKADKVKIAS